MALEKPLGFERCPRQKALKDRHRLPPLGTDVPDRTNGICRTEVNLERPRTQWDEIVHLVAPLHSGCASAGHVTADIDSASRGGPLYEGVVPPGRLVRTVFLCCYFLNDTF